MPLPSAVKITKNGVEYTSKVDRCKYLLVELQRAALRDVGKLVRRRVLDQVRKRRGLRRGRRPPNAHQYWVRKRETNLQVGIKHDTWYGVHQELGTANQPQRSMLRDAVFHNLDEIRRIEGVYLSAIDDENRALGLVAEEVEFENEPV